MRWYESFNENLLPLNAKEITSNLLMFLHLRSEVFQSKLSKFNLIIRKRLQDVLLYSRDLFCSFKETTPSLYHNVQKIRYTAHGLVLPKCTPI